MDRLLFCFLVGCLWVGSVPVAAQENGPSKMDEGLQRAIGRAKGKAAALAAELAKCRAQGQDTTHPDAALAVAEVFIAFSEHDAKDKALRGSASRSMEYVAGLLDKGLREAANVRAGKADFPRIPDWNVIGLETRDGGLWSGDEEIFLTGFNWDASLVRSQPELAKRLGINLTDGMVIGGMKTSGEFSDQSLTGNYGPYLDQMARQNFAVDCLLNMKPPGWLLKKHPELISQGYGHYENYVIDHPLMRAYHRAFLDHYIPQYARHKALFAIDLANEPAFQAASAVNLAAWRKWLRQKYTDVTALNKAWGTDFETIATIRRFPAQVDVRKSPWDRGKVDFAKLGVRGMHYDWSAFNKVRVTALFQEINERIQHHAPDVATHVKIMMGNYFTGSTEARGWKMGLSYNTFGIDAQALAEMSGLSGCDYGLRDLADQATPSRYHGSIPYVCGWLNAGLTADFFKSVCPGKPFYNSEFHAVEEVDETDMRTSSGEHMQTALWLAHLHGMSANLLWYWGRSSDGAVKGHGKGWFKGSLLQQPWLLRAYVQESLNLRRFVPEITAFARQPREVCLLYSEASAIQDVGHIDAVRDAYEALNFLGASVGFVTERQLMAGGPAAPTKLLVVPNPGYVHDATLAALRRAQARGIVVRIIGAQALSLTPVGQPRPDAPVAGARRLALGTPQDYHRQFAVWFQRAKILPDLLALDGEGKPAWGVEVRTAHVQGRRLAYLVNLMKMPVTVHLQWRTRDADLRDLRTRKPVPQSLTLGPRELAFGEY